jgi:replicative DNA helicase
MASPKKRTRLTPSTIETLVSRIDRLSRAPVESDTVPTGFASLDKILGGGLRHGDLVVLGGDVGSGKSALGLAIAIRAAAAGTPTVYFSGEMGPDRVMERALALEAKVSIDELRRGQLAEPLRAAVGAAAIRLRDTPWQVRPLLGTDFAEIATALDALPHGRLLVIDSLQLVTAPQSASRLEERVAFAVRALKSLALEKGVVVLALSQLAHHSAGRPDPRPTLDDFGALGAIKQNADAVMLIYREEMYSPGQGVEGATELTLAKNRNGPTGFVDLYFYPRWLRFVDMLDAD